MQELADTVWLADVAFLADTTKPLNVLNVRLQGRDAVCHCAMCNLQLLQKKVSLCLKWQLWLHFPSACRLPAVMLYLFNYRKGL